MDPDNHDFRPRAGQLDANGDEYLIDQGVPVSVTREQLFTYENIGNATNHAADTAVIETIDVTTDFNGDAPDLGAYEYGDTTYWLPGRQDEQASMPVPRINGEYVVLDADLMYLIGLGGVSANIYFGEDPSSLKYLTSKVAPENIVTLSDFVTLDGNVQYYWRVDTVLADGSVVVGEVWSFKTMINREFIPMTSKSISGGATWLFDSVYSYDNSGTAHSNSSILYSTDSYLANGGFKLTIGYTTDSTDTTGAHMLGFGLVSDETNFESYTGGNPFFNQSDVYSLGVNVVANGDGTVQGLNFTDGSVLTTLDTAGTNIQFGSKDNFETRESTVVEIEIRPNGAWSYSIDGIVEASGVIEDGFDLSKHYHVVVYGRDDNANKAIQHISLEYNAAPEANAVSQVTDEDSPIAITLSGFDQEGDSLSYSVLSQPANGALSGTLPNLTYTPHANYNGTDIFSYAVNDGSSNSDEATVSITVDPVNDVPVAEAVSATVVEDDFVVVTLNGSDIDGDALNYLIVTSPEHGILSGTAPNLTYTPDANYNGSDVFTYRVNDGSVNSAVVTVSLNIVGSNDTPTFESSPELGDLTANASFSGSLADIADDIDGDALTYSILSGPDWLSIAPDGTLSGTPEFLDSGLNTWVIQVSDGNGGTATTTLEITVLSEILLGYDFDAGTSDATVVADSISASQFTSPMDIGYVATAGDNTGMDATGADLGDAATLGCIGIGVNDAITGNFADAVAGDDYMSFTITPDVGVTIQLSGITFLAVKKSGNSVDEYAVADAAGNLIGGTVAITTVSSELTTTYDGVLVDLAGTSLESITEATEFRIYAWGRGTTKTSNTLATLDKVTLHGSAVVEPVANWTLDDGDSSTAIDRSGNGYNGSITDATFVDGIDGTALDFNGSSTEITLPASAFASLDQQVTISMWAYGSTELPKSHSVLQALDAAGNRILNIHLPWRNSNVYWDAGFDTAYDRIHKAAATSQFSGSWSHWVFVKNASIGTMEIYRNGSLFHSGTGKTKSMLGISSVTLGSQGGHFYYSGLIDDVLLFEVALTAEEVAELYDSY
jgi:hypothetical protein